MKLGNSESGKMDKLAKVLTDYVIKKGTVDEEDRRVYEYGFTVALEIGIFLLFCITFAILNHMFWEGCLFFFLFFPLRSYAGGLHLKQFWACLILSCLTFSGVLLTMNMVCLPKEILLGTQVLLECMVYKTYPVDDINRIVEQAENMVFKSKLRKLLVMDLLLGPVFIVLKRTDLLMELVLVLLIIFITMLIGKWKNSRIV